MTLKTHYLYKLPLCWPHLIFFQVTLYLTSNGWRMDSCWCLTDATKFCLTAVSSRFLGPKLQTLAGTAAWPLTVQGIAADTSTSTSWVQTNTTLFNPMRIIFRNNQTISDESHVLMLYSLFFASFSDHWWVRSWRFFRGGDSNSEQPHFSVVWSPILSSCSHHLAQGWHSVWV